MDAVGLGRERAGTVRSPGNGSNITRQPCGQKEAQAEQRASLAEVYRRTPAARCAWHVQSWPATGVAFQEPAGVAAADSDARRECSRNGGSAAPPMAGWQLGRWSWMEWPFSPTSATPGREQRASERVSKARKRSSSPDGAALSLLAPSKIPANCHGRLLSRLPSLHSKKARPSQWPRCYPGPL